MADSLDSVVSRTQAGEKKGKRKNKQEGVDTPEKREARISLYAERASMRGPNGRPLNIFTGIEYTQEEVDGNDEDEE